MTGKSGQSERLVESLARGESQLNAARLTGLSARTIRRRLADPAFVAEVDRFRGQMLETASGRLASLLNDAADALKELMTPDTPPAVRLAAARATLEHCCRIREAVEVERRISELEALAKRESK